MIVLLRSGEYQFYFPDVVPWTRAIASEVFGSISGRGRIGARSYASLIYGL